MGGWPHEQIKYGEIGQSTICWILLWGQQAPQILECALQSNSWIRCWIIGFAKYWLTQVFKNWYLRNLHKCLLRQGLAWLWTNWRPFWGFFQSRDDPKIWYLEVGLNSQKSSHLFRLLKLLRKSEGFIRVCFLRSLLGSLLWSLVELNWQVWIEWSGANEAPSLPFGFFPGLFPLLVVRAPFGLYERVRWSHEARVLDFESS